MLHWTGRGCGKSLLKFIAATAVKNLFAASKRIRKPVPQVFGPDLKTDILSGLTNLLEILLVSSVNAVNNDRSLTRLIRRGTPPLYR